MKKYTISYNELCTGKCTSIAENRHFLNVHVMAAETDTLITLLSLFEPAWSIIFRDLKSRYPYFKNKIFFLDFTLNVHILLFLGLLYFIYSKFVKNVIYIIST